MWPRIIRALLCAATTRAAAATSHVVDDFNTTEGMFTLTSQVPPVSTTEVTETSDGVRLDYSSHHLEMYSGFPYAADDGADVRTHGRAGVGRGGPHESCGRRGGGRAARASGLNHTYI